LRFRFWKDGPSNREAAIEGSGIDGSAGLEVDRRMSWHTDGLCFTSFGYHWHYSQF
jgi:hypothetical protein